MNFLVGAVLSVSFSALAASRKWHLAHREPEPKFFVGMEEENQA